MLEWYENKTEESRFRQLAGDAAPSLALAVMSVIFFPVLPMVLSSGETSTSANPLFAILFELPALGASVVCLLFGLGVGVRVRRKLGVGGNFVVIVGFVLWGVYGYYNPPSYSEGYNWREVENMKRVREHSALVNAALNGDAPARQQFEKEADEGDPLAQLGIGSLEKDNVEAFKWIYLAVSAAEDGEPDRYLAEDILRWGNGELSKLTREMTPEQIAKAKELASEWQREHSWWRGWW